MGKYEKYENKQKFLPQTHLRRAQVYHREVTAYRFNAFMYYLMYKSNVCNMFAKKKSTNTGANTSQVYWV